MYFRSMIKEICLYWNEITMISILFHCLWYETNYKYPFLIEENLGTLCNKNITRVYAAVIKNKNDRKLVSFV